MDEPSAGSHGASATAQATESALMSQSLRKFAAECAGAGVCLLLLVGGLVVTHSLQTVWMLSGQGLLLIFACGLGWWARSKITPAAADEIKTNPTDPVPDVTHTSKRVTESTPLERLRVAIEAADIAPWEFDLVNHRFVWLGARLTAFGRTRDRAGATFRCAAQLHAPGRRDELYRGVDQGHRHWRRFAFVSLSHERHRRQDSSHPELHAHSAQ
jgi:hypothetical protein